jgi:hypothetical protein
MVAKARLLFLRIQDLSKIVKAATGMFVFN